MICPAGALAAFQGCLCATEGQLETDFLHAALAHLDANQVTLVKDLPEKPQGQASLVVQGIEIYLPLSGLMDNAAEGARMQKELDDLASQIARLETLLGSSFAEKAPPAVVEKERQKLAGYRESAEKLSGQLADLG